VLRIRIRDPVPFSPLDPGSGIGLFRIPVSPAYGYIRSAPIKCSNDGGPGPRHTMKKDPGYSIFSMPVVYGYYLHLLTSSEKRAIGRISENPLPPFKPPWAEPPSLPPGVRAPPPANRPRPGRPQRNRTSASDSRSEAAPTSRGGCGDHFGLFGAPVRGQAAELVTSAGWPARFSLRNRSASLLETGRPVPQDRSMAGRYRTGVYIRDPSVLSYHSAATCRGGHVSSHIEKKN